VLNQELATDGYLKATLHRVQSPLVGTDRISIPFFFNPALDAVVPHLELAPELQAGARGLSVDPTNSPILETYGENVLRYRLRAHPMSRRSITRICWADRRGAVVPARYR